MTDRVEGPWRLELSRTGWKINILKTKQDSVLIPQADKIEQKKLGWLA